MQWQAWSMLTRHAAESANLEPWFGPHLQRNIYLSLLHMEPEEGAEKSPRVPDSVIRAALIRRAVEDIHRIIQVRTAKAACSSLLQRGSVGDDLWQRFTRAEKEMEEELRDVVQEVRSFVSLFLWLFLSSTNVRSGKCPRSWVGSNDFPVSPRDCRQRSPPKTS
jgi:translocation protein SEC66